MKIIFLGTGTSQGVPVIGCQCAVCSSSDYKDKRLRTSVHIEVDNLHLNIDVGPDFRQQMLTNRIRRLDAILLTHEHKDHTAGLDDVRSFNFLQQQDMPVYARQSVLDQITHEFAYIFAPVKYPGVPRVNRMPITNRAFTLQGVEITPIEVMHYKLPVFGFKIKNMAYITDANFISNIEKEKLKGLEVLILNALQIKPHLSHFTLAEALELIEELKPQKAYLLHISHTLGKARDIAPTLPNHVNLAYDGLTITL